jgi:hypothetical protein
MNIIGTVKLNDVVKYTDFPYGPLNLIAGKEVGLIKELEESYICLFGYHGVLEVYKEDVLYVNLSEFIDANSLFNAHSQSLSDHIISLDLGSKPHDKICLGNGDDRSSISLESSQTSC